jgi:CRISPR-associated protein (TIGR02584 family)
MSPTDPNSETILLAVTGMSPAVLTETLWALAREEEPVIPHRVIVVTTLAGRRRIEAELFAPKPDFGDMSAWEALRASLRAAGHDLDGRLRFGTTPDDVRVITAPDPGTGLSRELEDLRTPAENTAAADFLLEQTRGLAANPDVRLVASIAGGRKTMGALLYACLTLLGRDDDRLTHVLVNDPFETLPGFFFPDQPGPPLAGRNGGLHAPAGAVVELADVPFVPIGNLFQRELGRAAGNFSHLVANCRSEVRQRACEELKVEIVTQRPVLRLNGVEIRLTEREHHLVICLAGRAKRGLPPVPSYGDALDALAAHEREWRDLLDGGRLPSGTPSAPTFGEVLEVSRAVSDLRKKLKTYGQPGLVLAAALPGRGRFSLDVPGPLIAIL